MELTQVKKANRGVRIDSNQLLADRTGQNIAGERAKSEGTG